MTDVKNKFLLTLLLLVGPMRACQLLDKTATWIKSKVPDFADNAKPVLVLISTTQKLMSFQSHATVNNDSVFQVSGGCRSRCY